STKGADGTGLGLAVVTSIIKNSGGAVCVESEVGRGTLFEVFWPLEPPQQHENSHRPLIVEPEIKNALSGRMVLVCDDAELVAQVVAETLELAGAETAICADPRDVLEAIKEDPDVWDLLVTDFDMPGMSGAELATAVREAGSTIPIVLVTALAQHARESSRFDAVLEKPVVSEELIATAHASIINRKAWGRSDS
ncbi:MAG: response regulator, partial [Pseudomonadota bacterium]